MLTAARVLGLTMAGILVAVGVAGVVGTTLDLFDPCMEWGMGSNSTLTPGDGGCPDGMGGTSRTRTGAVVHMAIVLAVVLLGPGAAIFGFVRDMRVPVTLGVMLLVAVSVPLSLSLAGPGVALAAGLILIGERGMPQGPRWEFWVRRGLGVLGLAYTVFVILWAALHPVAGHAWVGVTSFASAGMAVGMGGFQSEARVVETHRGEPPSV